MAQQLWNYVDHALHASAADLASLASSVAWANITGKPSVFPPSGHHASHEFGGADLISLSNLRGVTVYVDHIAEQTGSHTITLDSNVTASGNITLADTKDLLCVVGAGSDIGATGTRFGSIFGTALYAVTHYADHIAENTGAHSIVMDNTVLPNADDTQSLGSTSLKWLGVFGKSFDSRRTDYGGFTVRCFNNAGGVYGAFRMIHARGSASSPTTLVTDSSLGFLEWMGYDGTDEEYGAYIAVSATENWTHAPEAHGAQLRFYTTTIGSDAPTLKVRIGDDGLYLNNTYDLLSYTAGGSDIGTAANYFGNSYITTMYVDHIKERTAAHAIFVDNILHVGDGTNYAQFAADGELTLAGTARVAKTIILANANLGKGTTAATQVVLGNYDGWEFDIDDDAVVTHGVPKDWASGTDITIDLSWYINEAYATNSGEVRWQVAWSMCPHNGSEAVDAPTHASSGDSGDINIPATAKTLSENTAVTIPAASIALGDEIGLTLKRVALTGGNNPTAKPTVIHLYIRYIADKLGTAT
jgi:hypothetical protein